MCDGVQFELDGRGRLVPPREVAQQLRLFLGQGPGGTVSLPQGEIVVTKSGEQWTMDLAGATEEEEEGKE